MRGLRRVEGRGLKRDYNSTYLGMRFNALVRVLCRQAAQALVLHGTARISETWRPDVDISVPSPKATLAAGMWHREIEATWM